MKLKIDPQQFSIGNKFVGWDWSIEGSVWPKCRPLIGWEHITL